MKTTDEIKEDVMALFDREVRNLPDSVYEDILKELVAELNERLDCLALNKSDRTGEDK